MLIDFLENQLTNRGGVWFFLACKKEIGMECRGGRGERSPLFALPLLCNTYPLLTEFEVRTVSYGPSFSRSLKSTGKKRGSEAYSTDRENEVSKIFTSLRLIGRAEKNFKVSGRTARKID